MCDPHLVSTDLMYRGFFLSLMSKILMPSQESGLDAVRGTLLHESLLRPWSVDRNNRSPWTVMSFCWPLQSTWDTIFGDFGFLTS